MLLQFKEELHKEDLWYANFGIEREGLRVTPEGELALTPHPKAFGNKLSNPYITTDFSESQIEMITPTYSTVEEAYQFLNALYQITVSELEDEYLWPQSMPCLISMEQEIPIALYEEGEAGRAAMNYRQALLEKYGGKKQLISGIHYNFSFNESLIQKLYEANHHELEYRLFKDQIYLKVVRNYIRYRWLLIYLLGASPVVDESYCSECRVSSKEVAPHSYSKLGAVSFRNSPCGYQNHMPIYVDYTDTAHYVHSLNEYIERGDISSFKEFYSPIRLKAKDPIHLMESLLQDGIEYIEIRSIDLNPFEATGISLADLQFIHLFILFLLEMDEREYDQWQEEATENERRVAMDGLQSELWLIQNGQEILLSDWAQSILDKMQTINETFSFNLDDILEDKRHQILNPTETISAKMIELISDSDYVKVNLELAKTYQENVLDQPYSLAGFEDLELSTQILIKEAIKQGIHIEVLDRSDNFICLKKGKREEFIQQATKTSLDSYSAVLAMENKVITKRMLRDKGISVPMGEVFTSLPAALASYSQFINQHIVIKPKSTNFGLGITMIEQLNSKKWFQQALEIAFNHDQSVIVEQFQRGNEYRFLVIDDEVVGVLQRIPANVTGDGIHTIEQLIQQKNEHPIRGVNYNRPLEKIKIDASLHLYLEAQQLTLTSIPKLGEKIQLRENSNISTGGDSVDMTDQMPSRFKEIARKAAKDLNVAICGVDMIIEDWRDESSNYSIIEMNYNPAIHIHTYPLIGKGRPVAQSILKALNFIS